MDNISSHAIDIGPKTVDTGKTSSLRHQVCINWEFTISDPNSSIRSILRGHHIITKKALCLHQERNM